MKTILKIAKHKFIFDRYDDAVNLAKKITKVLPQIATIKKYNLTKKNEK